MMFRRLIDSEPASALQSAKVASCWHQRLCYRLSRAVTPHKSLNSSRHWCHFLSLTLRPLRSRNPRGTSPTRVSFTRSEELQY
ncbi:hypothetical protein TNCV_2849951 [Trichonephila clavipes]|nr:hypothetical protein TNCV_2849951 [Trichonephila clavipes]